MSKQISRNGGTTIKASRKTAHEKVFFILGQKGHFFPKNGVTMKKVIALNLKYWYQCFSEKQKVDGESLVYDKVFEIKKHFFNNSYIFFKNYPFENIVVLIPSPKYCNANI